MKQINDDDDDDDMSYSRFGCIPQKRILGIIGAGFYRLDTLPVAQARMMGRELITTPNIVCLFIHNKRL